jgi:type II secretory pathway pseudopilin PulG
MNPRGKTHGELEKSAVEQAGFTMVEVIIAAIIMIILCVGTMTVFTHAVKINRGNNLRSQAQSVLQNEIEYYRSLKFLPFGTSAALNGKVETNMGTRTSADNTVFRVFVTIDNDPATADVQTAGDSTTKFKEITIRAVPNIAETGWLADLKTEITIQRVRGN